MGRHHPPQNGVSQKLQSLVVCEERQPIGEKGVNEPTNRREEKKGVNQLERREETSQPIAEEQGGGNKCSDVARCSGLQREKERFVTQPAGLGRCLRLAHVLSTKTRVKLSWGPSRVSNNNGDGA